MQTIYKHGFCAQNDGLENFMKLTRVQRYSRNFCQEC